jgi:hypothetical protein
VSIRHRSRLIPDDVQVAQPLQNFVVNASRREAILDLAGLSALADFE